jgi:hypothetical protein
VEIVRRSLRGCEVEFADGTQQLSAATERDPNVLQILIAQSRRTEKSMRLSAKACAYSDMPELFEPLGHSLHREA